MTEYFAKHGIKACAVISGTISTNNNELEYRRKSTYVLDRKNALERLKNAEISIIFSVDMFNEGLDIPEIDMVMFLRPTESPTVFLQQLGRGLRKKARRNM
jgi:superfamily II DNA or RNA helicase